MRILHILDHSIPLHSGYTFRTAAILREQRALGWETFHLTSPKQGETKSMVEEVEGLRFHRTAIPAPARSAESWASGASSGLPGAAVAAPSPPLLSPGFAVAANPCPVLAGGLRRCSEGGGHKSFN